MRMLLPLVAAGLMGGGVPEAPQPEPRRDPEPRREPTLEDLERFEAQEDAAIREAAKHAWLMESAPKYRKAFEKRQRVQARRLRERR